jgi:hypothetical protein
MPFVVIALGACSTGTSNPPPPDDSGADTGDGETGATADETGDGDGGTVGDTTGDGDGDGSSGDGDGTTGDGDGDGDVCGDGIVGTSEECDGGSGCNGNCELENFGCNPITNAGCGALETCAMNADLDDWSCTGPVEPGLPAQGDSCASTGVDACAPGFVCIQGQFVTGCSQGQGCCTAWCDTNDATTCPAGDECLVWWIPGVLDAPGPGLDHLGTCSPP